MWKGEIASERGAEWRYYVKVVVVRGCVHRGEKRKTEIGFKTTNRIKRRKEEIIGCGRV